MLKFENKEKTHAHNLIEEKHARALSKFIELEVDKGKCKRIYVYFMVFKRKSNTLPPVYWLTTPGNLIMANLFSFVGLNIQT